MKTVKVVLASMGLASLLLVGACKDDPIKMMEEMTEEICACEDAECLQKVQEKWEKKAPKEAPKDLTPEQEKKIEELAMKMAGCAMKASGLGDMGGEE